MQRSFLFVSLLLAFTIAARAYDTVVVFNEVNYNPATAGAGADRRLFVRTRYRAP